MPCSFPSHTDAERLVQNARGNVVECCGAAKVFDGVCLAFLAILAWVDVGGVRVYVRVQA